MSEALVKLQDAIRHTAKHGELPVVICDIDSTLVSTGRRHLQILREFSLSWGDPALQAYVAQLSPDDFFWSVHEPLDRAGFTHAAMRKALARTWSHAFFSDALADIDAPVNGAVAYCRGMASLGALLVYLTGRDAPGMGAGTARLLARCGFPLFDGHGLMMLKAGNSSQDRDHKRDALVHVAKLGVVVGSLENEPAYVNTFYETFPTGIHICMGDVCSPDAPRLDSRAYRAPDFAQ